LVCSTSIFGNDCAGAVVDGLNRPHVSEFHEGE
jgi:hypothetical protein